MKQNGKKNNSSRRKFIKQTAAAAAGITIVPRHVLGGGVYTDPSDQLNIAGIGVGGMGRANLRAMESQLIVALCDVDWRYSQKTFDDYPDAKQYKNYRKILDELGDEIDVVLIVIPNHTHALTKAESMLREKHLYFKKHLKNSIYNYRY